eukprot:symbB.v1.2.034094.t1/scaffold4239.1/size42578/1
MRSHGMNAQVDARRSSAPVAAGVPVHMPKSGRRSLDSAMQLGPRETEATDDAAGASSAAPSAALVAAVQKAAKASANPETLNFSPLPPHNRPLQASPFLRPEEVPEGLVGRKRWASMTEEEMMTGIRRGSKELPLDLAAYPSPGMSPTLAPTWRVGRDAAADPYGPGARRRWASLSDDEAASPMLWPMRSPGLGPGLHVQRPGRRSQSNTPLLGPTGMGLAKVSEHAECEDFMLPPTPQATSPTRSDRQAPNMSPTSQGKNMPMTPENYPMAWPNWDVMGGFPPAMEAWPQMWIMPRDDGLWPQVPGYTPGMPQVNEMGSYPPGVGPPFGWMPMAPDVQAAQAQMWLSGSSEMPGGDLSGPWMQFEDGAVPSMPSGMATSAAASLGVAGSTPLAQCSLVWVGEKAFRAQAAEKEELERLGFTVKIYRTHDRCSRVLDKKSVLATTTVFLISEAEAMPMLEYLQKRGAMAGVNLTSPKPTNRQGLFGWRVPQKSWLLALQKERGNPTYAMSVLDSLFAKTSGKASTPTRFTFNSEGILAPLTSLATAGRRSLSRSNSFSGLLSAQRQDAPQKPKARLTIHGDAVGVSLASAMSESVLGQRRTQRSHTDPGRSVQLVFHGPYGGDGAPVSTSMSVPASTGAKGGAGAVPRRPSFMDMGFSLPSMPVADEKESPRMS